MTNGEKYKTPEERLEAFYAFCTNEMEQAVGCSKCPLRGRGNLLICLLHWLVMEAEKKAINKEKGTSNEV